jgi:hypothetical protein
MLSVSPDEAIGSSTSQRRMNPSEPGFSSAVFGGDKVLVLTGAAVLRTGNSVVTTMITAAEEQGRF